MIDQEGFIGPTVLNCIRASHLLNGKYDLGGTREGAFRRNSVISMINIQFI